MCNLVRCWVGKGLHTYPINPNVNVIARLEFRLTYYDYKHVSHNPMGLPQSRRRKILNLNQLYFVIKCPCVTRRWYIQVYNVFSWVFDWCLYRSVESFLIENFQDQNYRIRVPSKVVLKSRNYCHIILFTLQINLLQFFATRKKCSCPCIKFIFSMTLISFCLVQRCSARIIGFGVFEVSGLGKCPRRFLVLPLIHRHLNWAITKNENLLRKKTRFFVRCFFLFCFFFCNLWVSRIKEETMRTKSMKRNVSSIWNRLADLVYSVKILFQVSSKVSYFT